MNTGSRPLVMEPNKKLTWRQRELLQLIEVRKQHGLPTVQRDLAEALGIRRESVNKLLRRTRIRLGQNGEFLQMPERRGQAAASVGSLMTGPLL